ncbi:Actin [Durusdinium trenchii]|uniref:Cytoskeletal 1A (Actin) n=2 Tax=Durusdinium trenchii TaxID=1381693 RepID=A0ABP0LGF3_9DINO
MEGPPIVLDNGSGTIKVGFAGECEPRVVHDNVFTALRASRNVPGGEDFAKALQANTARFPVMDHGIVSQWEGLLEVIEAALEEMKADASKHPVLLTEAPLNPTVHRELLVERFFEELHVPALQVVHSGALALYATNSRTGLVIEVGDGVAQTVPLYDSYVIFNAVKRRDYGGRDLTAYLGELMSKEINHRPSSSEVGWRAWKEVKESMCRVRHKNPVEEASKQLSFYLPDGKVVTRDSECLTKCVDALFEPARLLKRDEEEQGIHKMAAESILESGRDTQKALAGNIVLSGGSMSFPGMCHRVEEELQKLLPTTVKAAVKLVKSPTYAAFTGGSIVASMPDLLDTFMTRSEYEEHGAAFIHKKSVRLTQPPTMS